MPDVVTINALPVAPFDQVYVPPVYPAVDAVRVTEPPLQKINGPLAVTVGCGGIGFTVTVLEVEVGAGQSAPDL